ncbi:MAG: hypothetical protein U0670_23955 [Anaerolineae bacterium]
MTEAEKTLTNLFCEVWTIKGSEVLIPLRLASHFLESAIKIEVFLTGMTCWTYVPLSTGQVGIAEEYPYEYWVPQEVGSQANSIEQAVALIRQHIQTLPSHIDLVGFNTYVDKVL